MSISIRKKAIAKKLLLHGICAINCAKGEYPRRRRNDWERHTYRGSENVEGVRSGSCPQGGLRPPIRWFHGRKQLSYPHAPTCTVPRAFWRILRNA